MPSKESSQSGGLSRRTFIAGAPCVAAGALLAGGGRAQAASASTTGAAGGSASRQAMGTRAGEASDTTAKVWVRLTRGDQRNGDGEEPIGRANWHKAKAYADAEVDAFKGACPGAAGKVRLRYGLKDDLSDAVATEWVGVDEAGDFTHQFDLTGLKPGSRYYYESQTADADGTAHAPRRGRFDTAPAADTPSDLTFCVMTCQMYHDRDHADGHPIYPSMGRLDPRFTCLTGDLVYYDNEAPSAVTPRLARYHWERMFSLPRLVDFVSGFGTYWLKDDHDTLSNDSWPGTEMGKLTFAEGQQIFRQQAPMTHGESYRTFRWGRDLQVWLAEGRDDRAPNKLPDGPEKTIWGAKQKEWFYHTVSQSNATWKVLVSPTPMVGPDRKNKNDNLANERYQYEGDELRHWIAQHAPDNLFVICGDRHWQYHSVHPETGLNEFSVGPASNSHAGGTPGYDPKIHRFHRVEGGFLSVVLKPSGPRASIEFRMHDVDGKVVYAFDPTRKA
ncbi:MAG: alkaline phosphatase [Phycisphaera sp.]|nr:alkaline phosphatase [Phycisphaera sp.]